MTTANSKYHLFNWRPKSFKYENDNFSKAYITSFGYPFNVGQNGVHRGFGTSGALHLNKTTSNLFATNRVGALHLFVQI
jgi:hypothetical protein